MPDEQPRALLRRLDDRAASIPGNGVRPVEERGRRWMKDARAIVRARRWRSLPHLGQDRRALRQPVLRRIGRGARTSGRAIHVDPPMSVASFIAVGGIGFAFTLERLRWSAPCSRSAQRRLGFSNGSPSGRGRAMNGGSSRPCLPSPSRTLFHRKALGAFHSEDHAHAWTNIVLWFRPAGRRALERLASSGPTAIAQARRHWR